MGVLAVAVMLAQAAVAVPLRPAPFPDRIQAALERGEQEGERLTFDAATELFTFSFRGDGGQRHEVVFDLPSRVRATVRVRVIREDDGWFLYRYYATNLSSSPQNLRSVALAMEPSDAAMWDAADGWKRFDLHGGGRVSFAYLGGPPTARPVTPGDTIIVDVRSRAGPAVVSVFVAGDHREARFPAGQARDWLAFRGNEDRAFGVTVGPGRASELPLAEAVQRIVDTALEWGWIGPAEGRDILTAMEGGSGPAAGLRRWLDTAGAAESDAPNEVQALIRELTGSTN